MAAAALRSTRVLVVDDDGDLREALVDALSPEFDVVGAHHGAAALAAKPASFDVILLDLNMPVLDGPGFKRVIDRQGTRVPVIVMSAERDGRVQSDAMGAAGFLAKPLEATTVVGSIRALCKNGSPLG